MVKIDIFGLASLELVREGKDPNNLSELLDKAIKIRRWLNKHQKNAEAIMRGDTIYNYDNVLKVYLKVI
jgi:hypothetical protein